MSLANTRVGIIGAGAIGGFFGMLLARAGAPVHFLFRSDFATVREHGLQLQSKQFGDYRPQPLHAYADAADMPPCDWLLVAAKTTGNPALAPVINQVAAPGAKVVLLQNGLSVEDAMRPLLRDDLHLLGGLCFVSAHRRGNGVVEHVAGARLTLGYHSGATTAAEAQTVLDEGAALFAASGIDAKPMADIAHARWQKLLLNIPLNGLSVVVQSGSLAMMSHPQTRALVRELMEEVAAGAAACGHPLSAASLEQAWAATDVKADYHPSMYLDFAAKRPLELEAIYAAPLAEVARVGFAMPKIEMLYQMLSFLDARNRQ
ncbi:putative 2-dehydropantoate 2-reductase [Pseudomonas schmalbachii]|uniref:2-dehydropantoate 2-reductase n=1 Tax=Pseudomonas schmalbachii TaxID=2816993 RepID=A0ABS3TTF9_9PSED|nr:putative 2-dehydropantoate 2-reductase [Pseudomonas schmalbachii]MBO3276956.1 putative 2-dehydropantoate 2-reductase [Pseudomonas schmalbachii]